MPKNVVIFSDGTGQAGGVRPDQRLSNVYKIFRAARVGPDNKIKPNEQVAFYDPGLGTDEDCTALTRAWRFISKTLSAATGRGITRNVTDCYEAILNLYEPGDRIFLFGFSRGAYTARCVANVIRLCGVPTRGRDGEALPRYRSETRAIADEAVRHVYEHGAGRDREKFRPEREWKAQQFRRRYGSEGADGGSNACPHFIGVFDTVASLGARGIVRFGIIAGLVVAAVLGSLLLAMLIDLFGTTARAFDIRPGDGELRPFGWLPDISTPVVFGLLLGSLLLAVAWKTFSSSFKYVRGYPEKPSFRWHFAKWRMGNYDGGLAPDVHFARHALALDEAREHFPRVGWGDPRVTAPPPPPVGPKPFVQMWFAGNHSDIGGSYPENESRLSDIALEWMLDQARSIPGPLLVDDSKVATFPDASAMQHCEIEQTRDKKPGWVPAFLWQSWPEKIRKVPPGAPMHETVEERFKLASVSKCGRGQPYRPPNLRDDPRFAGYYSQPLTHP